MPLEEKFILLKNYIKTLDSAAVAFSAGVDSTFLLKIAHEILGENLIVLTANSPLIPKRELNEAIDFCKCENIKHIIFDFNLDKIKNNPENRCYICKKNIFEEFIKIAKNYKIKNILEGSNIDDENDYRPGLKAVEELKILSPLRICGLNKNEIRILSKNIALKTHNKPSFACLASRFSYGEKITEKKLKMVEFAEDFLFESGFKQFRVRIHENIARIEVLEQDFERVLRMRKKIYSKFREYGFSYTALDLMGYRIGSMNEVFEKK